MDIKTVLACGELILAVGDDPGRAVRHYTTAGESGSVNSTALRKLKLLVSEGYLVGSPGLYRGRPTLCLSLSARGQGAYGLLRALRELVS